MISHGRVAQSGRASGLQPEGQGFESPTRYNDSGAQHLENAVGVNNHSLMNKIAAILVRLIFP